MVVRFSIFGAITFACGVMDAGTLERDVVVYGSTPAAITAAIEAQAMGRSVVVVSPERRIGGLTTGGLGATDVGDKAAYGGLALKFYRDLRTHYRDPKSWKWQKADDYRAGNRCFDMSGSDAVWFFEPSAALRVLEDWERNYALDIRRNERLDRGNGKVKVDEVEVEGRGRQRTIRSFFTEDGTEYWGKVFIDATYEGDLMAAAGVSYFVGREDNAVYGETVSGFQPRPKHGGHSLRPGIDPYVRKGCPDSGLLPGVLPYEAVKARAVGSGDTYVQAYNIRMCLTDCPENRVPFSKPVGYDERAYELLFRNFEAGETEFPRSQGRMPNRKTDTNNNGGFSTDFIGRSWTWPEATYEERAKLADEHLKYQQGLMWTLANHPRVPAHVRSEFAKWGTCRDEFVEEGMGGWQRVIYVREARRMIGEYVMTEGNCRGERVASRPIALGTYGMDSHNVMRYVGVDGFVYNEGDVQDWQAQGRPYPIDYGAIVPKRAECGNLIVPVCVSASHMAFGSIRMEPVFFCLGQAAGAAAALAVADAIAVQDVDYQILRRRLVRRGQYLEGKTAELNPIASVRTIAIPASSPFDQALCASAVRQAVRVAESVKPWAIVFSYDSAKGTASGNELCEDLGNLGRKLRAAVDDVSPDMRMGVSVRPENDADSEALIAFARELAGPGRPFVRNDASVRTYRRFPEDFEFFLGLPSDDSPLSDGEVSARCFEHVNFGVSGFLCEKVSAHEGTGPRNDRRDSLMVEWPRLQALKNELRGRYVRGCYGWPGRVDAYVSIGDESKVKVFCCTDNQERELVMTVACLGTDVLPGLDIALSDEWRSLPLQEADGGGKWMPSAFAKATRPGQVRIFRVLK